MLNGAPKTLPRKYVDLVYASIGKYGNWDPTVAIKLGDYGYIDRTTGAFNTQGNIFDLQGDFAQRHAAVLATIGNPVDHPADDFTVIISTGVKNCRPAVNANLSAPVAIADFSLKWEFTFGKKHGIALVMLKPAITKFPKEGNLKPLLELIQQDLEGKALVTSVTTCPAYGFIVSRGRDESATIGLASSSPLPSLPISVGAGVELTWSHSSTAGTWKTGSEKGCTYTPVIELSVLKKWWSSNHDPATHRLPLGLAPSDSPFQTLLPPWAPLDDDGEETVEDEDY